ncbi:MAG TPA: hypothetical protein VN956_25500 [Pyrinomonadaceae bacterium]|nr:hypothetical protein [Pyrinomonadaceae bacterium]
MSIKSDKWIRRMVQECAMIEPFEPHQVKEVDGRRVVSYGTSSYGYDVRCADEFKLFTNVYSAIVDPKKFDAKRVLSTSRPITSSFHRIVLRSRAGWNTFAFLGTS